jgi:hypothetical protein
MASTPPTPTTNNSVLLGEDKLSSPELLSVSSPVLVPGARAPKNTPAGRSFDDNITSSMEGLEGQSSNSPSKLAAALDQLKLAEGSDDPTAFGLTALGELTSEVEELLQQHETTISVMEREYIEERIALEEKYNKLREKTRNERADIINGVATKQTTGELTTTTDDNVTTTTTNGVPEFWSKCIQNHPQLSTLLGEQDESALQHLLDIRITHPIGEYNNGFAIEFYFSENKYFTNKVLTKTYHMESMVLRLAEEPELLRKFS